MKRRGESEEYQTVIQDHHDNQKGDNSFPDTRVEIRNIHNY